MIPVLCCCYERLRLLGVAECCSPVWIHGRALGARRVVDIDDAFRQAGASPRSIGPAVSAAALVESSFLRFVKLLTKPFCAATVGRAEENERARKQECTATRLNPHPKVTRYRIPIHA